MNVVISPALIPFSLEVSIEAYVAALEQRVSGNSVILRLWADIHERMAAALDMMGEGCSLLAEHNWNAATALLARAEAIQHTR
jgi:Iap family predicted aminopeptidase